MENDSFFKSLKNEGARSFIGLPPMSDSLADKLERSKEKRGENYREE